MKLSMMSYTVARQNKKGEPFDIRNLCEMTRRLGLEAIDMVTLYGSSAREVRRITDDFGLETICYTFFADVNFAGRKEREPGVEVIRKGMDTALILGADKIMLPIGGKKEFAREQSRENVIRGLQEATRHAHETHVTMTIENFPQNTSPFIVSDDVLKALREVEGLMLTFDNGNVVTGGEDAAESFEKTKEYVVHAHFKDWTRAEPGQGRTGLDGRSYRSALIGEGIVDHKACIEKMAQAGYEGYIDIEYEGNDYAAEEAVAKAKDYLEKLIAGAKGKRKRPGA